MKTAEIEDLLDRWEECRRQNKDVSIGELCGGDAELRKQLESSIHALEAVSWMDDLSDGGDGWQSRRTGPLTPGPSLPQTELTIDEFAESVSETGLITDGDLQRFRDELSADDDQSSTTLALAERIVADGKLTSYQVSVILKASDDPLLIDRYVILDTLGVGGMGVVFKALHKAMDRVVALKLLPADAVDSREKVERFQREARAAARLSHPNIVTVHDAAESNGSHFLAMEYVNGPDLSTIIREQGPVSVAEAVRFVRDAARGLEHAHEQGIVHRDIKPGNLLLAPGAVVKVADLGLATIDSARPLDQEQPELTQGGMILGTVAFISPEQALETQSADGRSDIYSLGATLFCLLTGRPPYAEETTMKTLIAHREYPVPALSDYREDVPDELGEICQRMLAKQVDDRFQAMSEVVDALDGLNISDDDGASFSASRISAGADTHPVNAAQEATLAVEYRAMPDTTLLTTAGTDRTGFSRVKTLMVGAAVLLMGVVIVIQTSDGKKVEIDVPDGSSISLKDLSTGKISPVALPGDKTKGPSWDLEKVPTPLPGLVAQPARIDGVRRWQLMYKEIVDRVVALAWHPNGKLIACATSQGPIYLVDADTLATRHCLLGHSAPAVRSKHSFSASVTSLAWNPDGSILASSSIDGTIRFWSPVGHQGQVVQAHTGGVNAVAWSHDGAILASAGDDHSVRLWTRDGVPVRILHGHTDAVLSVAWSPNDSQLASGGRDQETRIWSVDGTPIQSIPDERGRVLQVCWLSDNRLATAAGTSGQLIELAKPEAGQLLENEASINVMCVSPDGGQLFTGTRSRTGRVWKSDGTQYRFTGHSAAVYAAAWSADGSRLAVASGDGEIRVFSNSGKSVASKQEDRSAESRSVSVSPDGSLILAGGFTGSVTLLRADGKELKRISDHTDYVWSVAWKPDGSEFVTASSDTTLRVYHADGTPTHLLKGHEAGVLAVSWSPDGSLIASAGSGKTVRLWQAVDGSPGPVLKGHTGTVRNISWSPDSRRLITGSDDRTAKIWNRDGSGGEPVASLGYTAYSVAWQPSGDLVAVGSTGGQIYLYESNEPEAHPSIIEPPNRTYVYALEWNTDGTLLASAHGDDTVRLWAPDGSPVGVLRDVGEDVVDLSWSGDGKKLATAATDKTARLWDAVTHRQVWTAVGLPGGGFATYAPDGRPIDVDDERVDEVFLYVVEHDDGRLQSMRPSEFEATFKPWQEK